MPQQMLTAELFMRAAMRCLCDRAPPPSTGPSGLIRATPPHAQPRPTPQLLPIAPLCHSPGMINDLGHGCRQSQR